MAGEDGDAWNKPPCMAGAEKEEGMFPCMLPMLSRLQADTSTRCCTEPTAQPLQRAKDVDLLWEQAGPDFRRPAADAAARARCVTLALRPASLLMRKASRLQVGRSAPVRRTTLKIEQLGVGGGVSEITKPAGIHQPTSWWQQALYKAFGASSASLQCTCVWEAWHHQHG